MENTPEEAENSMLKFSEFPQLRLIAWNLRHTNTVEECDAFGLYD